MFRSLEHNKDERWLRNDTVARYLALVFQGRDDIELIVGLQGKDALSDYYLQKIACRENCAELPAERFITFHMKNNNHFVLSAFEVKEDFVEVFYLDPMGAKMPEAIKTQYRNAFGRVVFRDASLLQQKDGVNCAVYLEENAKIVANTKRSFSELFKQRDTLFLTLDARAIREKREDMVETLNTAYPDCYVLSENGAIQLVSEQPVDVPQLTAQEYHDQANRKINALLDQGDMDADAFEAMFDAAVDAYQTLDTAHLLEQHGSSKLLADTVRFFKSADQQFSASQKALSHNAQPLKIMQSCAVEANELEKADSFGNKTTLGILS